MSSFETIAKPKWVQELLQRNPEEMLWQVYFRENETKTGQVVHFLLPKHLIPLLEDYVHNYRPVLARADDPGLLFLNSAGHAISINAVTNLVEAITVRYTGRRVNPHLFRDIFAWKWLEEHPEDYLRLSKILWHRNVQTTLSVYGNKFDESQGVRRAEEWLEKRSVTEKLR